MQLFGDLPQEVAMRKLIHDTASANAGIKQTIQNMMEHHNVDIISNQALLNEYLNRILFYNEQAERAIDVYYIKFQYDFPEHSPDTANPG